MINLYIIHVKFWQNYFIGKDRSSPMIIVKIKNVAIATFFFWYSKWDCITRVGKIIHRIIFAFVSAGPRPARNSATSFSSPTVIVKIKKCSYCYIFILVPKVGLYNPRRKNNPQDYFCLRFGRPQTSAKLGNLLFESHSHS